MKKTINYTLMCLMTLLFVACEDSNSPMDSDHGISIALNWADDNDKEIEISDVRVWIYQADGKLIIEKQYSSKQQVALDIHAVDDGEYRVVAAINLVAPFSVSKATTAQELLFKLEEASASPVHAHYSVTMVNVKPNENSQAVVSLRRILSEFSIEVESAPQGTTLVASINNVADGILPLQKDDDGEWGRATSGSKNVVTIPEATTIGGAISTQTIRLMPTALQAATRANTTNSLLHFVFTHADGTIIICDAEAPAMYASGKYSLKMKYSELKAYMLIDPIKINDWEEGWTVSGEILNPEN